MFNEKEAYQYRGYMPDLSGATIREIPGTDRFSVYHPRKITHYQAVQSMAEAFMEAVRHPREQPDFDGLLVFKRQRLLQSFGW